MALPAHLSKYDAMIDVLVDLLVRDLEQPQTKTPPDLESEGVPLQPDNINEQRRHDSTERPSAAIQTP